MKTFRPLLGLAAGLSLACAAAPAFAQAPTAPAPAAPPALPAFNAPQTPAAVERALLDGIAFAKAELAAGRFETLRLGPPPSPQESARIALLSRQGVAVISAGDVLGAALIAYVDANNAIMDAAIRQKYGNDFWERLDAQAPLGGNGS